MLFEIFRDGKVMMHTRYEDCLPTYREQKLLIADGYTLKIDGKLHKPRKTKEKHGNREPPPE